MYVEKQKGYPGTQLEDKKNYECGQSLSGYNLGTTSFEEKAEHFRAHVDLGHPLLHVAFLM